jgi:hypothetical protein
MLSCLVILEISLCIEEPSDPETISSESTRPFAISRSIPSRFQAPVPHQGTASINMSLSDQHRAYNGDPSLDATEAAGQNPHEKATLGNRREERRLEE